jgi:hypothetical protein
LLRKKNKEPLEVFNIWKNIEMRENEKGIFTTTMRNRCREKLRRVSRQGQEQD